MPDTLHEICYDQAGLRCGLTSLHQDMLAIPKKQGGKRTAPDRVTALLLLQADSRHGQARADSPDTRGQPRVMRP